MKKWKSYLFQSVSGWVQESRIKLVRPAKKMMESQIEEFHISEAAKSQFKASGIFYIRDLYSEDMIVEPGWFAVRELFDEISSWL